MKIHDVPQRERRAGGAQASLLDRRVGGTRARVLEFLTAHPDEVFRIRQSEEVAESLGVPKRTVEHALWWPAREGLIARARLGREVWYGSHAAIEELTSLRPDAVSLSRSAVLREDPPVLRREAWLAMVRRPFPRCWPPWRPMRG